MGSTGSRIRPRLPHLPEYARCGVGGKRAICGGDRGRGKGVGPSSRAERHPSDRGLASPTDRIPGWPSLAGVSFPAARVWRGLGKFPHTGGFGHPTRVRAAGKTSGTQPGDLQAATRRSPHRYLVCPLNGVREETDHLFGGWHDLGGHAVGTRRAKWMEFRTEFILARQFSAPLVRPLLGVI